MPHVKGNKFKPKPAEPPPEPEPAAAAAAAQPAAAAAAAAPPGGAKRKKKSKKGKAAAAAQQQQLGDVAVEPAAPAAAGAAAAAAGAGAGAGAAGGPPPNKKRRKGQQQQQQQPAQPGVIPTVVAPVLRPSVAPAEGKAAATSNWAALKAAMEAAKQAAAADGKPQWRRKPRGEEGGAAAAATAVQPAVPANRPQSMGSDTAPTKVVAIDCEMVGVGPGGEQSALARVCVVNSAGNVLLDRFVRPKERVTDFRTKFSGIRAGDLREAAPFEEVQGQVAELLRGRIVVGHAIENDLEALLLSHRRKDVRDTSRYPPLMAARGGRLKPRALRHLAAEQLGLAIQEGEHSPVDDARAALYLYLRHRKEWERWAAAGGRHSEHPATVAAAAAAAMGGFTVAGRSRSSKSSAARMQLSLEELARKGDHLADL